MSAFYEDYERTVNLLLRENAAKITELEVEKSNLEKAKEIAYWLAKAEVRRLDDIVKWGMWDMVLDSQEFDYTERETFKKLLEKLGIETEYWPISKPYHYTLKKHVHEIQNH